MSGFINNYYYGKAGKADFTPENLPDSRVKLFFEMLRIHFSGICVVNLMYLVFLIPAVVWTFINYLVVMAEADPTAIKGHIFFYLLGMVPCLSLAGVGTPGLMYVLRNWARDQHAFTFSDFKDAVKGNWKQALVVGLINGASLLVSYVAIDYYGQMSAQSFLWVVPQMLVIMMLAMWWMINMLIFNMMVTYDMTLKVLIRNCALIALARLPWSLLTLAGSFALPLVIVRFVPYGYLAILLIYLVVGFGLTGFIYASYGNSCFDKYLNPKIEGAPVNMGLRDKSLDEDDEDEDDDIKV